MVQRVGPQGPEGWPTGARGLVHRVKRVGPQGPEGWPTGSRGLAHRVQRVGPRGPNLRVQGGQSLTSCCASFCARGDTPLGEVGLQLAVFIDTEWLEKARIGASSV